MNLHKFLARGMSEVERRKQEEVERATEKARAVWLNAIGTDELSTWCHIGEQQVKPLRGLSITLTMAGMCATYDARTPDTPAVRVIRGAISAIEDCISRRDGRISADDARALSAAADHAREAIRKASHAAIQHAVTSMRSLVGLP